MNMDLLSEELRERNYVQRTTQTRKLTLDGETKVYDVYKVRLELLYYNDQNDRIATYIAQYKSENGVDAFRSLDRKDYNDVVESFIVQSNSVSIEKTQNNIYAVNQREPGVVLSDGRVIDGNRRFTCLRRLAADYPDEPAFHWFETVILKERMSNDKKRIKMLELAIQHGEEKKVDYNSIDRLVGIYQDVIKTKLLTVEEYAQSTNESEAEVKRKIECVSLLVDFLEYIGLPEYFHIARDYQIVSVLEVMCSLLKKEKNAERQGKLKEVIFNNIFMKTTGDSRKYIRNISKMMGTNIYTTYLKKQEELGNTLRIALTEQMPRNMKEIDAFISANAQLADEMRDMSDKAVLKSKKRETKTRPSKIVSQSITSLKDVDTKIFKTLNSTELEELTEKVDRLTKRITDIKEALPSNNTEDIHENMPVLSSGTETVIEHSLAPKSASLQNSLIDTTGQAETKYTIAERHISEPMAICTDMENPVTNLGFRLNFRLEKPLPFQKDVVKYQLFFLNEEEKVVSEVNTVELSSEQTVSCNFTLSSDMSEKKICYLAIRSVGDSENMLQQKVPFCIKMCFTADFGF